MDVRACLMSNRVRYPLDWYMSAMHTHGQLTRSGSWAQRRRGIHVTPMFGHMGKHKRWVGEFLFYSYLLFGEAKRCDRKKLKFHIPLFKSQPRSQSLKELKTGISHSYPGESKTLRVCVCVYGVSASAVCGNLRGTVPVRRASCRWCCAGCVVCVCVSWARLGGDKLKLKLNLKLKLKLKLKLNDLAKKGPKIK